MRKANQLVRKQSELEKALKYWHSQAHNVHVKHRYITDWKDVEE